VPEKWRVPSNPPRNDSRQAAQHGQDYSTVYPWHLIDHEAAAWIREISGTLSNPNQNYEDSENTGCQQRDSHASSPDDGNLTAQGRASSRVGLPSTPRRALAAFRASCSQRSLMIDPTNTATPTSSFHFKPGARRVLRPWCRSWFTERLR